MNQLLSLKQRVRTESSGLDCEVLAYLGGGGQGEVYRARLAGQEVALKWYYPASATQHQRQTLAALIRAGAPDARFLWPIELCSVAGTQGFGYVMPLRDARYRSIQDYMKRRVVPTFRAVCTAGLELADSFKQLHAKGLCYRDVSFGNVFFDPACGDVLICDNDNVAVDKDADPGILGTPRFMAPEIVRGDALPSSQSDLFSLAVLLFYLLMGHHPLEGAREAAIHSLDLPAMNRLYGTDPLFIFDPSNTSNRPVRGYQDNALAFWPIYPQFVRDLFTRSFTEGLHDPENGRVRESEWRAALAHLRDWILFCSRCNRENFYDTHALKLSGGVPGNCWSCGRQLVLPFRLRISTSITMLNPGTVLYPHHVDDARSFDFTKPVAEVVRQSGDRHGPRLKNVSDEKWVAVAPDASLSEVLPGSALPLASGLRIQFGRCEGEVRS